MQGEAMTRVIWISPTEVFEVNNKNFGFDCYSSRNKQSKICSRAILLLMALRVFQIVLLCSESAGDKNKKL